MRSLLSRLVKAAASPRARHAASEYVVILSFAYAAVIIFVKVALTKQGG